MLLHQHYVSEGSVSAAVKLSSRSIFKDSTALPVNSGLVFKNTGVLDEVQSAGNAQPIIGEWLLTGSAAGFWIQRTIVSGTLETDPGPGWLQLSTDRIYVNTNSTTGER